MQARTLAPIAPVTEPLQLETHCVQQSRADLWSRPGTDCSPGFCGRRGCAKLAWVETPEVVWPWFGRRHNEKEQSQKLGPSSGILLRDSAEQRTVVRATGNGRAGRGAWYLVRHFLNTNFWKCKRNTFALLPSASKDWVSRSCGLSLARSWIGPVLETKAQCLVPTFSLQRGMGVHRIEVGSRAL